MKFQNSSTPANSKSLVCPNRKSSRSGWRVQFIVYLAKSIAVETTDPVTDPFTDPVIDPVTDPAI